MNLSSDNSSATVGPTRRDSLVTALIKNLIVTLLCLIINYINGTQIHTFRKHQIFNSNPRYILFIHLVINDMLQLFLSSLLHVITYVFVRVNVSFCSIILVTIILTTLNTPLNLASMAIERYIAICLPLRYGHICTVRKTYSLIGLMWVLSVFAILPDFFALLTTQPLTFFHSPVICLREQVFRSAYSVVKRDVSHTIFLVLVWLTLVYTYINIVCAAKRASAQAQRARNTILLHAFQVLLSMLNYVRVLFEQGLLLLLPGHYMSIIFASYVIIQILPRFISPIVYGLRDQTFRKYVSRYLLCKMGLGGH
ncbi:odorant receptor 131-2-like [Takifugu flavidus]|uniref:odorant receptor 131-2-like n=1 Tax=Takifugu flavidus TaxID=433684 RepID=UPI002544A6FA|nr:odorant receptor 131-2-like [Takifugu flavidus]